MVNLSCWHLRDKNADTTFLHSHGNLISLTGGGGGSSKGGGGAGSQGREVKTKKVNKKWRGRYKDDDDREDNDDEAGM